jgi:hypothetical protein
LRVWNRSVLPVSMLVTVTAVKVIVVMLMLLCAWLFVPDEVNHMVTVIALSTPNVILLLRQTRNDPGVTRGRRFG